MTCMPWVTFVQKLAALLAFSNLTAQIAEHGVVTPHTKGHVYSHHKVDLEIGSV